MSVLIAIPTGAYVENDVIVALWKLDCGGHDIDLAISRSYNVSRNRNELAEYAVDNGYSHVLMVDSDTVPPRDALKNLMSHDVDVCLGYYPKRGAMRLSSLVPMGSDMNMAMSFVASFCSCANIIEVGRGGFGCALVKTDVFRRLEKPWFRYGDDDDSPSEDYYFCDKCREAGIGVYADPRVMCGHIMQDTVYE